MTASDAHRLHGGLVTSFVAAMPRVADSWMELRDGYAVAVCPPIPLPGFNGLWIDGEVSPKELSRAIDEVETAGVECWLLVRAGTVGPFDPIASELGFRLEETVPAMSVKPGDLLDAPANGAGVRRITADEVGATIDVAAAGFEGPVPVFEAMYSSIMATPGFAVYEARVDGVAVSTACSWLADGAVGIYNVATPAEHRRRGYGRAVTERAIRDGFDAGADLAWLQASELGAPVYRSMGFRQVETYHVYAKVDQLAG